MLAGQLDRLHRLDRRHGPLLHRFQRANDAQERPICQRLELEHRSGDPPGLLQPLLEVAFGVLQSTGPHLGDPEVSQYACAHLLAEAKFRGLG